MDLYSTIKTRRSVRSFKEEEVSQEVLEKILKAGIWAPSAGNQQSWEFIVVKDESNQEELVRGALGQNFIAEAPVVIVVGANKKRSAQRYGERGKKLYCLLDAAAAIQNMLLTAHALGLGSCWIGAFRNEEVKEVVRFPEYVRPVAIIPIGKPAESPSIPSRYPLDQVVHEEQYSK